MGYRRTGFYCVVSAVCFRVMRVNCVIVIYHECKRVVHMCVCIAHSKLTQFLNSHNHNQSYSDELVSMELPTYVTGSVPAEEV